MRKNDKLNTVFFAADGDFVGFIPELATGLGDVINKGASATAEGIVESMAENVVKPISDLWYAKEATTFGTSLHDAVAKTGEAITEIFQSFSTAINEAGKNWSLRTGNSFTELPSVTPVELNLDVSAIVELGPGGEAGIKPGAAKAFANQLDAAKTEIQSKIESVRGELNGETAFLGGGQGTAMDECYNSLTALVVKLFDFLTNGEDSCQGQINKYAAEYESLAEEHASGFNSSIQS